MPIQNYDGNTFIAYMDISGFKFIMKDRAKAISVLKHFYQSGFDLIHNQAGCNIKVEGFFISDCAVLFTRSSIADDGSSLRKLLKFVERLNNKMLECDTMLTTSIGYGYFNYEGKFEISGTEKNQIFGDAYVEAFLDNEINKPKIRPGECRIIINNLPTKIKQLLIDNSKANRILKKGNHFYFYWMVQSTDQIDEFIKRYNDSYNLQFRGMIEALKSTQ